MPGGDGTGPLGFGPMTGRRVGYCAGYRQPGFANPYAGYPMFAYGRRMSVGFGGRGRRFRRYAIGAPSAHRFARHGPAFW